LQRHQRQRPLWRVSALMPGAQLAHQLEMDALRHDLAGQIGRVRPVAGNEFVVLLPTETRSYVYGWVGTGTAEAAISGSCLVRQQEA
jgi:hypothetical protein